MDHFVGCGCRIELAVDVCDGLEGFSEAAAEAGMYVGSRCYLDRSFGGTLDFSS